MRVQRGEYSLGIKKTWKASVLLCTVGGPQEKMSFFQIAPGPILSIPIRLKTCLYGPCKFLLKKNDPFLTYKPPKVSIFCRCSRLVNSPLLLAICSVVIQHSYGKFKQRNCSSAWVDDACAVWVHNSSIIQSDDALERRTPLYLLKMEGTKVDVGIGTIYRRIHQFPLLVWPILLVHHGMFGAWKWLTYIGGGCMYSVGQNYLWLFHLGYKSGGHHGLWAKVP